MESYHTLREFFHFVNWSDRDITVRGGRVYDMAGNALAEYTTTKEQTL